MKVRILHGRRAVAAAAAVVVAMLGLSGCSPNASVGIDVPAQVDAELPADTVAQLEAAVTSAMGAAGATGAIVGVWAPWSGTWIAGLGAQGPGDAEPVSSDMTFRAATITRAMTCDVLYRVVRNGTVALDDKVTQYVPSVPELTEVTLRELCDSSSGLGAYSPQLQAMWMANPDRVWNSRELASYGLATKEDSAPGSTFRESDAGYLLLGLALERATGQSMSHLLQQQVTGPLGLGATSLPSASPQAPGPRPLHGHWSAPDAEGAWNCTDPLDITEISASIGGADSGVVTDITDLGRYAQALASGALVGEDSERFAAPLTVGEDQPSWFTTAGGAYQAGSLVGQYGSIPGYMTAAFADPDTGMSIAVVLNNSGANESIASWLAWELAAIASKAPAAEGQSAPEAGLPWTAQQFHDQILANAICAPPAA